MLWRQGHLRRAELSPQPAETAALETRPGGAIQGSFSAALCEEEAELARVGLAQVVSLRLGDWPGLPKGNQC